MILGYQEYNCVPNNYRKRLREQRGREIFESFYPEA
jgi:hypothetical protein